MDKLTPVIFRKVKIGGFKGDLIAVFPETMEGYVHDLVMCYERVGQHGSASWDWVTTQTEKASPDEYKNLLRHLVFDIGYDNLKIVLKRSAKMKTKALNNLLHIAN